MAACLMPNESPSRDAGTELARVRLDASWPSTLHQAPASRISSSAVKEPARVPIGEHRPAPAPSTATRLVGPAPKRSTSQPHGSEASALTPKYSGDHQAEPGRVEAELGGDLHGQPAGEEHRQHGDRGRA